MKRLTALWLLLSLNPGAVAQRQASIWYFATGLGLDFRSGGPVAITGGQTGHYGGRQHPQEGTSVLSDGNGALLCYSGGMCVWNAQHRIMPNGNNLGGNPSATQSSIILPKPGSRNLLYLFTAADLGAFAAPPVPASQQGYRYSVIDMCLDSGRGDIRSGQKNILLLDSNMERMAACRAGETEDYWIVGHGVRSDSFFAWRLSASGISSPVISEIGRRPAALIETAGQMKFSPDGRKLATVHYRTNPAVLEIMDFNTATGKLSNLCRITIDSGAAVYTLYSLEFSPDGSKLYLLYTEQDLHRQLLQFDFNAGTRDCESISASRYLLRRLGNISANPTGLQLAPDGKIYCQDSTNRLGTITNPNAAGSTSGYNPAAVTISYSDAIASFPSFVAGLRYTNGTPACPTGLQAPQMERRAELVLSPNPSLDGRISCRYSAAKPLTPFRVRVLNALGQPVFERAYSPMNNTLSETIPFRLATSGVYFVRLESNGESLQQRFVVY